MDYGRFSDGELEARFDDLYTQIMAGFDSLPAATWTAEYKAARRDIQALEVQFRSIGVELARRLADRAGRFNEVIDGLIIETGDE